MEKVDTQTRIVVDCFTFYNEIQMLNYRLHLLDPVVDYFILSEATHTHSGKEKELFYEKNKDMFKKFHHKIIHLVIDDFPYKYPNIDCAKNEQWVNEKYQRSIMRRGIEKLSLKDTDLIMVSDLDEIPDPRIVAKMKTNIDYNINVYQFMMDLYYYNLHNRMRRDWEKSKIMSYYAYNVLQKQGITLDDIRMNSGWPSLNGGWHMSYFGDTNFIRNKLIHFSHQEYNKEQYTNETYLQGKLRSGTNLFDNTRFVYLKLEDNDYLPPLFEHFLDGFYDKK